MSSICDVHWHREPDCSLCNTDITELIPNYEQLLAEAEAAGLHECKFCGFKFYLTVEFCPKCSHEAYTD